MIRWAIVKPISLTIFKEFSATLLILFVIALSVFLLVFYSPNEDMMYEYMLMITENMPDTENLDFEDLSFTTAFFLWLNALITGNFGLSLSNGMPALDQALEYLVNSTYLIAYAMLVSLIVALPFAGLLFKNSNPILQKLLSVFLNSLSFFPIFWIAYMFIYLSGIWFDYFPLTESFESDTSNSYLLPTLLLAVGSGLIIEIAHTISNEISRVYKEDYILCARAKGASVLRHVFKEAIAFPLLTLLNNRIAYLFGATIIIEQIFNWPGIGRLLWQATQSRDLPLLLSAILITVVVIRIAQFMAKVCYILINPRASHE